MERLRRATDSFLEVFCYYIGILLAASLAFSFFEGKTLLESIWWAGVTAMSVGYGDIYPITIGGKIVAFILIHIVLLGIVPLIVARMLDHIQVNRNEFAHEEQEEIKNDLKDIKKHLGIADVEKN